MAKLIFTSSESFLDFDPAAIERRELEVSGYLEGTYSDLRVGPNGEVIAIFENDAWTILTTGERASDWAIGV